MYYMYYINLLYALLCVMSAERCLRCVPHDEDTGGFFVATLRKIPKHNKADIGIDMAVSVSKSVPTPCIPEEDEVITTASTDSTPEFGDKKTQFYCSE